MFNASGAPTASRDGINAHCEIVHALANALAHQGQLVIACFGEDPDKPNPKTGAPGCPLLPVVVHVEIGDIETMVRTIVSLTVRQHCNAYMPLAVVRPDLPKGKKGFEYDIVSVLGLVADFDDSNAAQWRERLPLEPSYVLETSFSRFQCFYFFDKPEPVAAVKPTAALLKAFAGCDHGTADLSHVWRIAGSLNWPNAKKLADGRSREPQVVRVVKTWDGSRMPLALLTAHLPAGEPQKAAPKKGGQRGMGDGDYTACDLRLALSDRGDERDRMVHGDASTADIESIVKVFPPRLRERITKPASRDRSRDLYYAIKALIARNLDDDTIERIIRRYPKGIGAKYVSRTDLDAEIRRIREKSSRRDAAQADAVKARGRARPTLQVWDGALPGIVDRAELLLIERDSDIFEFGDQIVRPAIEPIRIAGDGTAPGLRLIPVGINHLIERFTYFIDFERFDARREEFVSIDCPKKVAATYLERVGAWRLRKLCAITTCPVLRRDGSVLEKPGFDEETGILVDPRHIDYPPIPAEPTRADAQASLAKLKLLISEFPFVDPPSRSVALSAMLTSISRLALSTAPMHAFDAPDAGTGKSKLVDASAVIATGHECPVIAQGTDETEMEKRLGAALIAGDRIISIDNCEHPLGGQFLCQALTQRLVKVRVLGHSKNITVPNAAVYFATGNNLRLASDMPRRAIVGRLDAGIERPELREFTTEDPVETLKRDRPKYVVACLTILRAYIVAGAPAQSRSLGSFEDWSRLVRDALIWLGEADPVETMERSRQENPEREALAAVLVQWGALLGLERVSVKKVIDKATDFDPSCGSADLNRRRFLHPEFREALLAIAGDGGSISGKRLGKWLSTIKGRVSSGLRINPDGVLQGVARYRLQRLRDGKWE